MNATTTRNSRCSTQKGHRVGRVKEKYEDENSVAARRDRAFEWYNRFAYPPYDEFLNKISRERGMNITKDDVDLLPWTMQSGELLVDRSTMMRMKLGQCNQHKAFEWYYRLGKPTRATFEAALENTHGIDGLKQRDIASLPWDRNQISLRYNKFDDDTCRNPDDADDVSSSDTEDLTEDSLSSEDRDDLLERRSKAREWYETLQQPTRHVFRRIMQETNVAESLTKADIDLLPWNESYQRLLTDEEISSIQDAEADADLTNAQEEFEDAKRRRMGEEAAEQTMREALEKELLEAQAAEQRRVQQEEAERHRVEEERLLREEHQAKERKRMEAEEAEKRRMRRLEEARKQRQEDEEAEQRRLEVEAARNRKRLEEEARRHREEEEAEKRRLEVEAEENRKRFEEEARRHRAEEEAEKRRLEAEAAQKRKHHEEEARRHRKEEEAEKRRLEAEADQKRKHLEEEVQRRRVVEERLQREAEEAQKQREEAEAAERKRKKLQEEAERRRLDSERRRHEQDDAARRRLDVEVLMTRQELLRTEETPVKRNHHTETDASARRLKREDSERRRHSEATVERRQGEKRGDRHRDHDVSVHEHLRTAEVELQRSAEKEENRHSDTQVSNFSTSHFPASSTSVTAEGRFLQIYAWYQRMGQPNRDNFKRRLGAVPDIGLTPDDADMLPWAHRGAWVNIRLVQKMVRDYTNAEKARGNQLPWERATCI